MKERKLQLISWLFVIISSLSLYFIATRYAIFPSRYKFPLLLVVILILCISGILSIVSKGKISRVISLLVNIFFIFLMVFGLIFLPNIENRIRNIFKDIKVDEAIVNVYVTNSKYNSDLKSFANSKFIIQSSLDQENQNYAIDQLKETLGSASLRTVNCEDVVSAVEALYNNEGDLLILNEAFVDSIVEIEKFINFASDTKVLCSFKKDIIIEKEEEPPVKPAEITERAFSIYVAGEDTRSGRLSTYGRTDVDIVVTVNPITKQILIVGFPRDTYIPNPALGNGYDKLTHLGNDGIENTIKGVNNYYHLDIDNYIVVNFITFRNIINALDGIDVENPYYFTTYGGNGSETGEVFEYPVGTLHLYGESALAYCRERWNLPNGDYGRSEHQTIVLRAIIQKLLSPAIITNYSDVLDSLQQQVLTNIAVDDIYKLIAMQLDDNATWDIISYRMGGEGDMQGTASMGWNQLLYVVHPFDSQAKFIKGEIEKMMNNENITQQVLPQEEDTTYIPN